MVDTLGFKLCVYVGLGHFCLGELVFSIDCGTACDEIRISVEFVTVGFLGYAGIHVMIDSRGYGDGVLAC